MWLDITSKYLTPIDGAGEGMVNVCEAVINRERRMEMKRNWEEERSMIVKL